MTSSESLRPLEDLKKRLEEIREMEGPHLSLKAAIKLNILIDKVFVLAEAYRKIALERFKAFPQTAPFYELFVDDEATEEASRLFKGEDGV